MRNRRMDLLYQKVSTSPHVTASKVKRAFPSLQADWNTTPQKYSFLTVMKQEVAVVGFGAYLPRLLSAADYPCKRISSTNLGKTTPRFQFSAWGRPGLWAEVPPPQAGSSQGWGHLLGYPWPSSVLPCGECGLGLSASLRWKPQISRYHLPSQKKTFYQSV